MNIPEVADKHATEYILDHTMFRSDGKAHRALVKAFARIIRKTLQEACKAQCPHCADGIPAYTLPKSPLYFHNKERQSHSDCLREVCEASGIRRMMDGT
jgi:hypothetical protein